MATIDVKDVLEYAEKQLDIVKNHQPKDGVRRECLNHAAGALAVIRRANGALTFDERERFEEINHQISTEAGKMADEANRAYYVTIPPITIAIGGNGIVQGNGPIVGAYYFPHFTDPNVRE